MRKVILSDLYVVLECIITRVIQASLSMTARFGRSRYDFYVTINLCIAVICNGYSSTINTDS